MNVNMVLVVSNQLLFVNTHPSIIWIEQSTPGANTHYYFYMNSCYLSYEFSQMCIIISRKFYYNSSFINESFYGHVGAARTWLLVWLKKILAFEAWLFIFFELHAWKQPFSEPERCETLVPTCGQGELRKQQRPLSSSLFCSTS